MRRQDRIAEATCHVVRVHYYAGSYIANGGGKRATCTAGPLNAAHALALKLFGNRPFNLAALAEPNAWRATTTQEAV